VVDFAPQNRGWRQLAVLEMPPARSDDKKIQQLIEVNQAQKILNFVYDY